MTMSASEQVISDPLRDQSRSKDCSNCGASFTCGPVAGKCNCWCEELPRVSLVAPADTDCLCPECLRTAIAKLPEPRASISDAGNSAPVATLSLVEGEDYYCEGATIVFTGSFLRRRGYCCDSGCRHCPYHVNKTQSSEA